MENGGLFPFMGMVIIQVGFAGMNILSKLAMDSGMNPYIHVAYRQIFAFLSIAPLAYLFERNTRPAMTRLIILEIFLSSIFGATLNQTLYFVGLQNSTPTIACAIANILPALTFLLAAVFGLEKVGMKSLAGYAKVVGTLTCVGGAMFLSFYHGNILLGKSTFHFSSISLRNDHHGSNFLSGPLLVMASTLAWAVWFIIQTRISEKYPAPFTSSSIVCFMASIQCIIIGLCFDHNPSSWSLAMPIRAFSSIYAGVVCTALAFCLMSWCIQKKGPLYVSVFNPLLLVIVAALSWILLEEKLYIGTVLGSLFIVLGLYLVLWGKKKEMLNVEVEINTLKIKGIKVEEEEKLGDLEV